MYFSSQSFSNAQQDTGSLGGLLTMVLGEECSTWSEQDLSTTTPSSCQNAPGLGLHLQHPHSPSHRGCSSPQAKNPLREGPAFRKYVGNCLKALSFGLFALPCPSLGRARTDSVFWDIPVVFSLQCCCFCHWEKQKIWFRTSKYQQFPHSSQVRVPNKEACNLGSCHKPHASPGLWNSKFWLWAASGTRGLVSRWGINQQHFLI